MTARFDANFSQDLVQLGDCRQLANLGPTLVLLADGFGRCIDLGSQFVRRRLYRYLVVQDGTSTKTQLLTGGRNVKHLQPTSE